MIQTCQKGSQKDWKFNSELHKKENLWLLLHIISRDQNKNLIFFLYFHNIQKKVLPAFKDLSNVDYCKHFLYYAFVVGLTLKVYFNTSARVYSNVVKFL